MSRMPNRGAFRGRGRPWSGNNDRNNGKFTDDHDDRDRKVTDVKRRVSFKPSTGRNTGKGRLNEMTIRAHLEDDDTMGERGERYDVDNRGGNYYRGNNRRGNRRKGSPVPRGHHGFMPKRKLLPGPTGWYQITIPYGHKHPKELILKSLLDQITPEVFIPHYYKVEDTSVSFFVDDFKAAEAIGNVDRRIQMPDGHKMIIKVRSGMPSVQVDESLKERMKLAMVKRYNPQTRSLNLAKFHADPELTDIFCALSRPTIMLAAVEIISENIPDLEALNLDDNKIHLLDHFKCMAGKLPNLKILHLGNNRIPSMVALDALKGVSLVDLKLEGNPCKDKIRDPTVYVSEVRKRLPKVNKLDGIDLPPAIGFDVEDEFKLPQPKASYLCNAAGADIVRQFLEQYFILYDSDNRQPLLEAYHENAMLSMTVAYTQPQNNQQRLTPYINYNRNLTRCKELETRCRHLKIGRLPVVSFLSELPATKHDPQSFVVDLSLFTPQLMLLTVTGVFKERKNNEPIRSFQRALVIVSSGGGYCIRNEVYHINLPTPKQEKNSFKEPSLMAPPAPILPQQVPVQQPPAIHPQQHAPGPAPDDNTKIQMVQAMSTDSHMNLEWSRKCLEETNWDYQRAGFIFTELHKQNKIPPEAFIT